MNKTSLFVCPKDRQKLIKDESGLLCSNCKSVYSIQDDIIRFVPGSNYSDSFGYEWQVFSKTQVDSANNVGQSEMRIRNGMGWKPEDVEGKTVLDVGCGSGRFSEIIANWGGKVVSLDYSVAVDEAKKNLAEQNLEATFVQGDALQLPFEDNTFDAVFSIGVLQHTANPLQGLREMCRVLKPGGLLGLHGVYLKSIKKLIHPKYILRPITKRVPHKILFPIVKKWVQFSLPISRFMRKKLHLRQGLVERITAVANYEGAVPGIDEDNVFEWALLDTFDWFSPAHDHPLTHKEIEQTLNDCGMENIVNVEPGAQGNSFKATKKYK